MFKKLLLRLNMLIIFSISIFLPFKLSAQNPGIGIFKLNEFVKEDIFKLADSLNIKTRLIDGSALTYVREYSTHDKTKFILFLENDTNNMSHSDQHASLTGRTVFIDYMEISSVELQNIYLSFYKDTLVSIECEATPNLVNALSYKYNNPSVKKITKPVRCLTALGIKVDHEETTYIYEWSLPKSYLLNHFIAEYYDDNCKKISYSNYELSDLYRKKKLKKSDSDILKAIELRKENEKLLKFKDI